MKLEVESRLKRFSEIPLNFVSTYKVLWWRFTVNLQVVAFNYAALQHFANLL